MGRAWRRQAAIFFAALAPSITPMTSDSFMIKRSSPSILTSVPDHLPNSTRSPDVKRNELAAFVTGSRPDGDHLAFLGLFLGGVRNDDAALRLVLSFDAADDDAVVQWTEFHEFLSRLTFRYRPRAKSPGVGSSYRPTLDSHC